MARTVVRRGGMATKAARDSMSLTVSVGMAARLLGIARNSGFAAVKSGDLPTIQVGKRLLVPRAKLAAMLDMTPDELNVHIERLT